MQMARRLELGYTPAFRFIHADEELNKHSLFKLVSNPSPRSGISKQQKQQTIAKAWGATMNRTG